MFKPKEIVEPKDTDAATAFMTALQMQFHVKKKEDEQGWLDSMVSELKWYSADVLELAAKNMIRRRRNEYFPVLSECLAACADAKQWLDAANPKMKFGGGQSASPASSDRTQLADQLVMGEMGHGAAKDGWILSLHDFIREQGRMPTPQESTRLKSEAKGFDRALDSCRDGGHPMAGSLRELGVSMVARRQTLTEMVLDGVVR